MLPAGAGVRWQRDNRLRSFGQDGNWATGEKTLMDRQEEEFAAIVERIGDVEHRWYRRRIVAASSALVLGAAIVGWSWAIWGSAWGGRRSGCRSWPVQTLPGLGSCAVLG